MNFKLLLSIFLPILIAIILNVYLLTTKNKLNQKNSKLPGWVVGLIWVILFGILGYIWYLFSTDIFISIAILILYGLCLTYPFYPEIIILLTTLFMTIITTILILLRSHNKKQVLLILPQLAWISYVSILENSYLFFR